MLKTTWSDLVNILPIFLSVATLCTADGDYRLNKHQKFILNGVTKIHRTLIPAAMTLLNKNAFPILTGHAEGVRRAHVAGAEWGNGRIVAYSHTSFYIDDLPDGVKNDNVKLAINSINWIRKNKGKKVGVFPGKNAIEKLLLQYEFEVHVLSTNDLHNLTLLQKFDALAINTYDTTGLTNIRSFVHDHGGGLLIGATTWHNFHDSETYWANIVLQDTGIVCVPYYLQGNKECNEECFLTSTELLKDLDASQAWEDLKKWNWIEATLPSDRLQQMTGILFDRLKYGPNDEKLNDNVKVETQRILPHISTVIPTPNAPVTQEKEKQYIIAHRHWSMFLNTIGITDDIPPHPAAKTFPGMVSSTPSLQKKARERKIVEIDGRVKWHSTGLYAQAGAKIEIRALDTNTSSLTDIQVQVGAHTDNLEELDQWKRFPNIVFQVQLKKGSATIANPFGGPIFITSTAQRNNSLKFSIDGGIPSPTYFLGKTNPTEWRNKIRNNPAPWGELVGKNFIMTYQSEHLSQIDNPEELIKLWDHILDADADLAAISHVRPYPERFVADVQIRRGGMHAGYPIMTHLYHQNQSLNLTEIRVSAWNIWGQLHELGHNHQQAAWKFDGSVEVTCNLFALYVEETLFNVSIERSHEQFNKTAVAKRISDYRGNGTQFSKWKSDPFLGFETYYQLKEAFGWSAYKTVFGRYHTLKVPQKDQEKMDLWMVEFSRAVKQNLFEFFISWGIPISPEAKKLVDNLPATSLRIPQL